MDVLRRRAPATHSAIAFRPAFTGQPCFPGPQNDLCHSTESGTCDEKRNCVGDPKPEGTDCRPAEGSNLCAVYTYETIGGRYACWSTTDIVIVCPTKPGCSKQMCDSLTGFCYADPPDLDGAKQCSSSLQCCPGQSCRCRRGDNICLLKYCYDQP